MAVRLPVTGPRRMRDAMTAPVDFTRSLVTLLPRVEALLAGGEGLLQRVTAVIARIETSEAAARQVIIEVDETQVRLRALTDPLQAADVAAARRALDAVPGMAAQISQLGPLLDTLTSVAPDLHELLASSRALNEIIGSVPGLSRAKKRADEQIDGPTGA